ncbi:MAG: flagellar FliJ family protein [Deltaproteobacteria bacterium]|nr:flagellar FliJ family protein [Deltaproteobacteria bacterium]
MSARIVRVKRLISAASSTVTARERELAEAHRALEAREEVLASAEADLESSSARWLDAASSDDLAQASARRRTLARRIELERRAVEAARSKVRVCEDAALEARRDERRLELLVEGLEAGEATRRKKVEQKVGDEHAARMGRNA